MDIPGYRAALRELISEPGPLLNRAPIEVDCSGFDESFKGKRILVTGAAGSIGSVLARLLLAHAPGALVLLDNSYHALRALDQELANHVHANGVHLIHGDILNQRLMQAVMTEHQIDVVFHAAALKHVPELENNAIAALRTNTLGTLVVAGEAAAACCEVFVLVSTDKSVEPTNVMGKSKHLAERVVTSLQEVESHTRFCSIRLGNVLGSSGSVVPRFLRQALAGADLTVTHRQVSRYFLTHSEAAKFVALAATIGEKGEVLVPMIAQPILIIDLARRLCNQLGVDENLTLTSLRSGDKLRERLHDGSAIRDGKHPVWREAGKALPGRELFHLSRKIQQACDAGPRAALSVLDECLDWVSESAELAVANQS